MSIYRGAGGSGDAVNDASSEATLVQSLVSGATTQANNAAASATAAQAASTQAAISQGLAEDSATAAATAETNAETAETNAETAQAAAEAAQTAAETAQAAAELAETNAETAETNAETAQAAAEAAQAAAETAQAAAELAETNASDSATAAATSATNAAASYDAFDDRYLGSKSSNPTVDNDGNALITGALYYNTVSSEMRVWEGTQWVFIGASGAAGVNSFNSRFGDVTLTSSDVTTALTYTPLAPAAIGTTVQAYDADLTTLGAGGSSARSFLGLAIGTDVQAYDAQLADIAGLTPTDNSFIVGNGTNFVAEGASTARTSLGLGTAATTAATDYATAAQGTKADSALQPATIDVSVQSYDVDTTKNDVANTFSANQIISVTDNSNAALRITQLGTGNALLVEDSANPDSSPFVIDTSGRVVVGSTTALNYGGFTPNIQVNAAGSAQIGISRFSANTAQNVFTFLKSRGATVGDFTSVASGDNLGSVNFYGADGTTGILAAQILSAVDGTPGTNDMPGRLVFSTTADGASSPTERMRINSVGSVTIGGSATVYQQLGLNGTYPVDSLISEVVSARGVIASGATSSASVFLSRISTQNATFTLPNLRHFHVSPGTFGASSTVTNQYGLLIESTVTGATNNYGVFSNIASGTGRWNFYVNGTADNYFAGNVGIGITSPTCALDVVGGIKTSRTAVTSPAATDGNVFSGTYTPTQVSTNTNVDSVTFTANQYMRVGNVVTVSGLIEINPTLAATQTIVKFSLPIASAFINAFQLGGTGSTTSAGFYATVNAAFMADTVNDCVEMRLTPTFTGSVDFRFHFTYRIV
jgi:hypothetical protein